MINASPNFMRAWQFALQWEGGKLENVPGDHGGLTKFGVDQASHPHVNIRALTADQAGQIYHDEEWTRCQCDKLPDDLAVALFDFAMNAGCSAAVHLLQETLRVQADGFLGPLTLAAAQKLGSAPYAVLEFLDRRAAFYRGIAAAHPDQAEFLKGWLNRVEALRQTLVPEKSLPVAALAPARGTAGSQNFTVSNQPGKSGAASGSVGLAAPLFLMTISALGLLSPVLFAEGHVDPTPETLKGWLEVFAYLAGLVLLVVHLVKAFRPEPSNDRKFASKDEMVRVEREAKERDTQHAAELTRLEAAFDVKHRENVRKLDGLHATLEANRTADHKEREKLREDVRHDVRAELQALETRQETRYENQIDRITDIVRGLGRVEGGRPT